MSRRIPRPATERGKAAARGREVFRRYHRTKASDVCDMENVLALLLTDLRAYAESMDMSWTDIQDVSELMGAADAAQDEHDHPEEIQ